MDQLHIIKNIDSALSSLYKHIPYSHYWQTLKSLGTSGQTLLDVACGDGQFMALINSDHRYLATGVDLFSPYLAKARATGAYVKLVKSDIKKLPFRQRSFDTVLCSQAIEHLYKADGFKLMKNLEAIAKKRVVFITPGGEMPQDPYDGNKYQKHLSTWSAHDFQSRGYTTAGQGLKILYGTGNAVKSWGLVSYLFSLLSLLAGPLLQLYPDLSVYLFCYKDVSPKE